MKKIIFFLMAIAISVPVFSQDKVLKDWANTQRYQQANSEVAAKPKAVFMGDSITEGWYRTDKEFFTENNYLGRGIGGQTTAQMVVRFQSDVVNLHPKYVAIMAGTNDIAQNNGYIALEQVVENLKSMCEIAKANKIKPILCSVTPSNGFSWSKKIDPVDPSSTIIRLNEMIKEYAASANIPYADYHSALKNETNGLSEEYSPDGTHLKLPAYKIIEAIIVKYFK